MKLLKHQLEISQNIMDPMMIMVQLNLIQHSRFEFCEIMRSTHYYFFVCEYFLSLRFIITNATLFYIILLFLMTK
jgi:hypothetical protein